MLVPLSTLLRPPELGAQLQVAGRHPPRRSRASSAVVRYLDDLEAVAPGIVARPREPAVAIPALPSLRAVWLADDLPDAAVDAALVDALEARVQPADDFVVLFTSGSRGAPKGTIHTHGSALHAVASGLDAAPRRCRRPALHPDAVLLDRRARRPGCSPRSSPVRRCSPKPCPSPSARLALLERERATLFRGWPDQAARARGASGVRDGRPLEPRPGQPAGGAARPRSDRRPGARANLFGMTETFGPYCGARLDVDLPPDKHGSCGRPFAGVEVRVVDPEIRAVVRRRRDRRDLRPRAAT